MTHGLTSVTGNMTYSGEPGGLNEATSDIMAAAVEFYANNPQDVGDYLVGEKIDINGDGSPLRYMDKPSKDGASKDAWYSGLGGIDVHYSSGPANHWYYLASEGSGAKVVNGVSYDSPTSDGLPVTAIGRDAASKIWFRALTTGLFKSNTNYAAARTATLQAAADLYGAGSTTYNNAANAWAAINVGARIVSGVSVTPIANQNTQINTAVSLQVQATSTNPGALSYAATGLLYHFVDQLLHRPDLGHGHHRGHVQRDRHGDRLAEQDRNGVLHLDGRHRPAERLREHERLPDRGQRHGRVPALGDPHGQRPEHAEGGREHRPHLRR